MSLVKISNEFKIIVEEGFNLHFFDLAIPETLNKIRDDVNSVADELGVVERITAISFTDMLTHQEYTISFINASFDFDEVVLRLTPSDINYGDELKPNSSFNEVIERAFDFCGIPDDEESYEDFHEVSGTLTELMNHFGHFAGWLGEFTSVTKQDTAIGNAYYVNYITNNPVNGVDNITTHSTPVMFIDGVIYLPSGY